MFFWKSTITEDQPPIDRLHKHVHQKSDFFPGQRPNEEVQLCIRTHWLQRAKIFMSFLLIGIILPGVIFYFLSGIDLPKEIQLIIYLVTIFYLLLVWIMTFIEFIKSEFTVVLATNERIVNIVEKSIFDREIAETNLDRIQEVAGHTSGFLRTSFDIGYLEIQTAGSDLPLLMRFIKSPQLTARKVLDIQKTSQKRRRSSDFGKRSTDKLQARHGEDFSKAELKKMRDDAAAARKPNGLM